MVRRGCGIAELVDWYIIGLVINVENDWRDVGRPHIAMPRNCHLLLILSYS